MTKEASLNGNKHHAPTNVKVVERIQQLDEARLYTLNEGLLAFFEELNRTDEIVDEDTIQVATPGDYTFQQDNAPIHVSKATKKFFQQHSLSVMKWPANSPDLNPIENL